MMAHTYHEMKEKTLAELREMARTLENDAVKGWSQMNKERLLPALCKALGVDMRDHHDVVGLDKAEVKAKMRQLKAQLDQAAESHDRMQMKMLRRQIHRLNHRIRAATV